MSHSLEEKKPNIFVPEPLSSPKIKTYVKKTQDHPI